MHQHVKRSLEASGASFGVRRHATFQPPIHTPQDFARALGYEPGRITKTILARSVDGPHLALIVAPHTMRIDFRKAAAALGQKRLQVAPRDDLQRSLGYPPGSVSPLGAGPIPVLIDASLFAYATILVGAGELGVEIEIDPHTLRGITTAAVLPLADGAECSQAGHGENVASMASVPPSRGARGHE